METSSSVRLPRSSWTLDIDLATAEARRDVLNGEFRDALPVHLDKVLKAFNDAVEESETWIDDFGSWNKSSNRRGILGGRCWGKSVVGQPFSFGNGNLVNLKTPKQIQGQTPQHQCRLSRGDKEAHQLEKVYSLISLYIHMNVCDVWWYISRSLALFGSVWFYEHGKMSKSTIPTIPYGCAGERCLHGICLPVNFEDWVRLSKAQSSLWTLSSIKKSELGDALCLVGYRPCTRIFFWLLLLQWYQRQHLVEVEGVEEVVGPQPIVVFFPWSFHHNVFGAGSVFAGVWDFCTV